MFAVWGAAVARGPFIQPTLDESFLLVIAFIVSTTLPSLMLSAAVSSRNLILEQTQEELFQAQKLEAIGQLTGGVAHDFNNLLMILSASLRMLDRPSQVDRRAEIMKSMHHAIDRGANLIRQLLAFSRRETLHPEVIDVAERVAGMDELLQRTLGTAIRVKLKFPPDLWLIEVDPTQLELVILNLAVNARDAMPQGGSLIVRAKNIQASETNPGEFVSIRVSDTGTGMTPDVQARAFEPFYTTKGPEAAQDSVSARFSASPLSREVLRTFAAYWDTARQSS